jgi:hypothetical protein
MVLDLVLVLELPWFVSFMSYLTILFKNMGHPHWSFRQYYILDEMTIIAVETETVIGILSLPLNPIFLSLTLNAKP